MTSPATLADVPATTPELAVTRATTRPMLPALPGGFSIGFWIAALYLALVVIAAAAPSLLAPADPLSTDTSAVLQPPSLAHWAGTDEAGRDLLSRLIFGARPALLLGVCATLIAVVAGSAIGVLAGVGNRVLDAILMRITDVSLAFPELLLALLIISVFGGGIVNTILAIGLAGIPSYARLVRAQTIAVRTAPYVEAARGIGSSPWAIAVHHVLPNAVRPVLVLATIGVGTATLAGAALSFLGLGVAPPTPEWGSMLSVSRNFLSLAWWYGVLPGLTVTGLVISATTVGRALQRRLEGRR